MSVKSSFNLSDVDHHRISMLSPWKGFKYIRSQSSGLYSEYDFYGETLKRHMYRKSAVIAKLILPLTTCAITQVTERHRADGTPQS